MRTTFSPWAVKALSPADRAEIAESDLTVLLGHSSGWTCRLSRDGTLLAEVFRGASAIGAYRAAVARLPEVVEWRGCLVAVV
jgi:hypothetical protein